MSFRIAALISVLGVTACAATPAAGPGSPSDPPTAPPSAPPPTAPPAPTIASNDLSGRWLVGEQNEPPAGPAKGCLATRIWTLSHQSGTLAGDMDYCVGPCAPMQERVQGKSSGDSIRLDGAFRANPEAEPEQVFYELRFDSSTQHLTGTRNGQPFWAAPLMPHRPEDCAATMQ